MTAALVSPVPAHDSFVPPPPRPVLGVVGAERPDSDLSVEELGSRIVGLAGRLAAATCRWLLLVADFDDRDGSQAFGLVSTARWLSHYCGLAHRTAVEHVRVAHALQAFPQLAAEMTGGRLSYSQVRAISRIPRAGEHELVDDLIGVARHGSAAQLEAMLRGLTVADHDGESVETRDYLRTGWAGDGAWRVTGRLPAEQGALIDSALDRVAGAENLTRPRALARLAEIALAAFAVADAEAGREAGADNGHASPSLRGEEHAAVVIHVDANAYPAPADAAPRGRARSAERDPDPDVERPQRAAGHLTHGPGLSQAVVERLACAGRVRLVTHDGDGNPLDVGRSHRLATHRQYRALLIRDGGCAHPGCGSRSGLHAHHVRHWLHGGATNLDNLILLCAHHHTALHDGRFHIVPTGRQRWRFVRADHALLPRHVTAADVWGDPPAPGYDEGDGCGSVAPDASVTRWDGQRLERPWAVTVLAERRKRTAENPVS